jgi:biopolymer transport protein TolR
MPMIPGGQPGPTADMNVTPMIDVLLVLLIIFLLIQPAAKSGELADIPQPGKTQVSTPEPKTIVIQLRDAGGGQAPTLKINDEEIGWNDLQNRLKEIYKFRMEKVAFLKGDPEVEFQFVVEVMDLTHEAGVDHVGLLGRQDKAYFDIPSGN